MKRSFRAAWSASMVAVMLGLAACGGGGGGSTDQVLQFGIGGEAPQLKPGVDQGNLGYTVNSLIHRGLISYGAEGEFVSALAEEFAQVSPSRYTFTLRDGLTFQDGSPLTVENVRSSWTYFADPAHGSVHAAAYANIADVADDGAGKITVELAKADSTFLQVLADVNTPILPDASLAPDATSNIGAGPYAFVEEQLGVGMTLESFDDYYAAENADLDGVELKYYPDGAARVNALLSGDVDLIDYVPWESFDQLEDAGFVVDGQVGPGLDLQFNHESEPLSDPKVREALAYAINRDKIVENVFAGRAAPLRGHIVQPDSELDIPAVTEMYEYDPDRAAQLLADAGYPDGFEIRLLSTSQYAFMQDTAISVEQDLEAIGVTTTLELPDFPTQMDKMLNGRYDLAIGTILATVTDPSYLLSYVNPPSFVHPFGYENAELSDLLRNGRAAVSDEERVTSYEQAFELLKADTPFVPMVQRTQAYAYNEDVQGFSSLPGFLVLLSALTVADVSLD